LVFASMQTALQNLVTVMPSCFQMTYGQQCLLPCETAHDVHPELKGFGCQRCSDSFSFGDGGSGGDRAAGAATGLLEVLLHCLLAVCFSATVLGVLSTFGLINRPECCAEEGGGYPWRFVLQDFRSLLSFIAGALYCHLGHSRPADGQTPRAAVVSACACANQAPQRCTAAAVGPKEPGVRQGRHGAATLGHSAAARTLQPPLRPRLCHPQRGT